MRRTSLKRKAMMIRRSLLWIRSENSMQIKIKTMIDRKKLIFKVAKVKGEEER